MADIKVYYQGRTRRLENASWWLCLDMVHYETNTKIYVPMSYKRHQSKVLAILNDESITGICEYMLKFTAGPETEEWFGFKNKTVFMVDGTFYVNQTGHGFTRMCNHARGLWVYTATDDNKLNQEPLRTRIIDGVKETKIPRSFIFDRLEKVLERPI